MPDRPALGEVRRPGRDRDQGAILTDAVRLEEVVGVAGGTGPEEEFRTTGVRHHIEAGGSRKVAFRHRSEMPSEAPTGANHNDRRTDVRIRRPVAANHATQRQRPERAMEVEAMRPFDRAQLASEVAQRAGAVPDDEIGEMGVVPKRVRHVGAHHEADACLRVAGTQHPDQRGGQQQVADRGESDDQDTRDVTGHAPNLPFPMARPRTILWIDDEIESLDSQVLFLEQHGFSVERAANGDDALALLRRQSYGVILLDEQMPGTRGLELVPMLRAIDSSLPVVMVTKSEEPDTLRDAIGAEIADYLIKPVAPRQVLSVITRLLEGDRIRQQRLSRDFVSRFRELESRRGETLAWREWVELVAELADWEVRLGAGNEPGLQEALRTLQSSVRLDFARFLARNYPGWLPVA